MYQRTTVIYQTGVFQEPVTFDFPLPCGFYFRNNQEAVLEYIFRQCNHVDGTEWIANQKLRSMSVGDMVLLAGQLWIVQGCGWKKV